MSRFSITKSHNNSFYVIAFFVQFGYTIAHLFPQIIVQKLLRIEQHRKDKIKRTINISSSESVKSVQRVLSFLLSKQSPLSWLQKPSEHATSEPSGELMREDEPDIVSQQPPLFPDE